MPAGPAAGVDRILAAVNETFEAGFEKVEIALVFDASPLGGLLAAHESVGAEAAKVLRLKLQRLLLGDGVPAHRFRFTNDGAPMTAVDALRRFRNNAQASAVAALIPHEMRSVDAACLRQLVEEYESAGEPATLVAANMSMDNLPKIEWLACRGRNKFARFFEDARAARSDMSELRMIGRCILSPTAIAACATARRDRPNTLVEILNAELASGRRVIAREFSRAAAALRPSASIHPLRSASLRPAQTA